MRLFLCALFACIVSRGQPSPPATSSSTAAPRPASSPRCRRSRWARRSSSSRRTSTSAASPAAASAGPTPATRRSSAAWPAISITGSGSTTTDDAAWRWQKRDEYGNKGQGTPAIDGEQRTMWIFEPHVAEQVFEDIVARVEIPSPRRVARPREGRRRRAGTRIVSITTLSRQDVSRHGCSSTPPTKAT